jgi:hypothetical protein
LVLHAGNRTVSPSRIKLKSPENSKVQAMKPYAYRDVGGQEQHMKECEGCDRMTSALYCCAACEAAHLGGYEIHETGMLAHSDLCNARHLQRGPMHPKRHAKAMQKINVRVRAKESLTFLDGYALQCGFGRCWLSGLQDDVWEWNYVFWSEQHAQNFIDMLQGYELEAVIDYQEELDAPPCQ